MARIDCSKTVNFLREWARMCESYTMCSAGCAMRELRLQHGHADCENTVQCHPKTVIEIVQEWSDEHPVKTRLDDLLEKYPKAWMEANSSVVAPWKLGYCRNCSKCSLNGRLLPDCWGEPVDGGATGEAVE